VVSERIRELSVRGLSMIELLVVIAIIGIITAGSMPMFMTYWRTSTLRAGAEEMAAILDGARQLAIKQATEVCVTNDGTRARYHVSTCAGTVWTGPGTDASGNLRLANNVTVSSGVNVVFGHLGDASTPGTYTVRNPVDGRTMRVVVATTGRVRIGP
jgi:prepilin-type N-terminal cleavage/methylation domain-containing protein